MKIDWFNSEEYFSTDESVKRQITDSISENLTDSDLESIVYGKFLQYVRKDKNVLKTLEKIFPNSDYMTKFYIFLLFFIMYLKFLERYSTN